VAEMVAVHGLRNDGQRGQTGYSTHQQQQAELYTVNKHRAYNMARPQYNKNKNIFNNERFGTNV